MNKPTGEQKDKELPRRSIMDDVSSKIHTLDDENKVLQQKLNEIKRRRQDIQIQKHRLVQIEAALQERHNQARAAQHEALLDYRSVVLRKRRVAHLLQLSQQWSVLSDCFQISHRGPFGTINGVRLGAEAPSLELPLNKNEGALAGKATRLGFGASQQDPTSAPIRVTWMEINAALGHVAALLSTLASRPHAGIVLRHSILPIGSTSKIGIRRGESISLYNLYSDDSFQFFGRRNFNIALNCLLECVQDAVEAIQSRDRTIAVPHVIEKHQDVPTIGGLSVAYGADGVAWTRAMKYLLTDLKHLLTFRALVLWVPHN